MYTSLIALSFLIGYILITLEHKVRVNKASTAILTGIICWGWLFLDPLGKSNTELLSELNVFTGEISQIIFFLLGAMTIVESISAHRGFEVVTDYIQVRTKRGFLWVISCVAFFLSSMIDNLTATLVIVSLVSKIIPERNDRLIIGGAVVIAANAGGAWTPIGDITTTMLWIGGQISTLPTIKSLFFPSFGSLVFALIPLTFYVHGDLKRIPETKEAKAPAATWVFFLGIGFLLFVPVFKTLTGLPPFLGVLFGLSLLWLITDLIHYKHPNRSHLRIPDVLAKVDISSVLFFLGILLAVDALEESGILRGLAIWLDNTMQNSHAVAIVIGLVSAVVDNIPLVAASMGMYENQFAQDAPFWQMLAYCAGTGGSILIIGSAAGIVFMALEKVNFFWFMRKISLPALLGYFAGIALYLLQLYLS